MAAKPSPSRPLEDLPRSVFVLTLATIGLSVTLRREGLMLIAPLYMTAFAALIWSWRFHAKWLAVPGVVMLGAIMFRLLPVFMEPHQVTLSDDYYRYLWDGKVASVGFNPFEYRPDDPVLAEQRKDFPFGKMNSADKFSVYPPVSQFVFLLPGLTARTVGFDASFIVMKALLVLLELGGIAFLLLAARRRREGEVGSVGANQRVADVALYAWNPLPIVAIAGNGHSEAGLVFGMGLAVWAVQSRRAAMSWVGLTLAGLSKLVPFAAVPLWWKRFGWRGAGLGVLVSLLMSWPFWFESLPTNYLQSLRLYVQVFEFNAPIYGTVGLGLKKLTWYWFCEDGCNIVGPTFAVLFFLVAGWIFVMHRVDTPAQLWRSVMLLLSAYLLLATTVHPWYALWVLVLVPVTPMLRRSWLWFSFASVLTYFSYDETGAIASGVHAITSAIVWLGFAWFAWRDGRPSLIGRVLRRRAKRKAEQILPHVEGRSVLDLGCGEGYVGAELAASGFDLTLCDVADMNKTDLPFHGYDGETLPFKDDAFDTVVLSLVLHHCADAQRVLNEATRVARLRVVITESTWETALDHKLINFLDRRANRLRGEPLREQEEHLMFRTVPQWREMIEAIGWQLDEMVWLNRFVHKHVLFVVKPG